jgi:hypothetical protein
VLANHFIEGFLVPVDQPGNQKSFGQAHLKRRPRARGAQPTGVGCLGCDGRRRCGREGSLHISMDSVAAEKFRGPGNKQPSV